VDVVVTNQAGQPIDGLGANDFQIFENKKRQQIRAFKGHIQIHSIELSNAPSLPPNTFTNANSFTPDSINLILLDQLNTSFQNQELARQAIISYVALKPPGAAFAIFTLRNDDPACLPFNYAQRSFGLTQGIVGGFGGNCLARGRLLMVQGITQDKNRLLAALDSKLAQPHVTLVRDAPRFIDMGISSDTYPDGVPEVEDSSMSALSDIGEFVHDLPGRKSLIWMSDSFDAAPIAQSVAVWFAGKFKGWERTDPFAPLQMLHLTADRLAEAGVALYIADLSGRYKDVEVKRACPIVYEDIGAAMWAALNDAPTHIDKQSEEWSCSQHFMKLSYLASHSGGQAFHGVATVQNAIQQAVIDESHYYTLVYSSNKTKFDGKVRNIRVALAQQGYRLAYRRAYFADDPSTLYPLGGTSQNVFIPLRVGPVLAVRVSGLDSGPKSNAGALGAALQYGAPESNDIAFTAHILERCSRFVVRAQSSYRNQAISLTTRPSHPSTSPAPPSSPKPDCHTGHKHGPPQHAPAPRHLPRSAEKSRSFLSSNPRADQSAPQNASRQRRASTQRA
jgi:VWFA-related protein